MDIKKLLLIIALCFTFNQIAVANNEYRIRLLVEISYDQAQLYPEWQVSTYTHRSYDGYTQTRYFIYASNIKNGSTIRVIREEGRACPCMVTINGYTYYADFIDGKDEIEVGDVGILKYYGSTLYFVKD